MTALPTPDAALEDCLRLAASLSADSKLALIAQLSADVRDELAAGATPDRFAQAFGAWESAESAEELIDELRASRVSTRQMEAF